MTPKKFSISVRIDKVTPSHVYLSVFSNMVLEKYCHEDVTRAKAGELVLTRDEFTPFLNHIRPHVITSITNDSKELDTIINDLKIYLLKFNGQIQPPYCYSNLNAAKSDAQLLDDQKLEWDNEYIGKHEASGEFRWVIFEQFLRENPLRKF